MRTGRLVLAFHGGQKDAAKRSQKELRCCRCWGEPPVGRLFCACWVRAHIPSARTRPCKLVWNTTSKPGRRLSSSEWCGPADHRARIFGVRWSKKFLAASTPAVRGISPESGVAALSGLSHCRSFCFSLILTLGMQGTLRKWVMALHLGTTTVVTPESAGWVHWQCCILASLWHTHIRDLSPTAEAVRGAAYPR